MYNKGQKRSRAGHSWIPRSEAGAHLGTHLVESSGIWFLPDQPVHYVQSPVKVPLSVLQSCACLFLHSAMDVL